jgi:hypothetical protein
MGLIDYYRQEKIKKKQKKKMKTRQGIEDVFVIVNGKEIKLYLWTHKECRKWEEDYKVTRNELILKDQEKQLKLAERNKDEKMIADILMAIEIITDRLEKVRDDSNIAMAISALRDGKIGREELENLNQIEYEDLMQTIKDFIMGRDVALLEIVMTRFDEWLLSHIAETMPMRTVQRQLMNYYKSALNGTLKKKL